MVEPNSFPEHERRARRYDRFRFLGNRIRYYERYKPASNPGRTAGARMVVEVKLDGRCRTWLESYDAEGKVIRVHPKMPVDLGHIEIDPQTGREIERW